MHRSALLELLDRYQRIWQADPAERRCIERIRTLIQQHGDCLHRTCRPGHITAAAWIVSADRRSFLLTHHKKLDRWLQLGGHVDGESRVERAALREAREESGMEQFEMVHHPASGEQLVPLDLDVHTIPAHADEPEHEHHDIRFLLIAAPGQTIRVSEESHDVRWFDHRRLEEMAGDPSVLRMGRKALALLGETDAASGAVS